MVVASLRRIRILRNISEITLHCGLQVSDFSTITRIKWLRLLTTYSEQEVYKQRFKKNDKAWSTFAPNSKLQVKAVSHVYEHSAIEWVENWRYRKLGTYSEEAAQGGINMRFSLPSILSPRSAERTSFSPRSRLQSWPPYLHERLSDGTTLRLNFTVPGWHSGGLATSRFDRRIPECGVLEAYPESLQEIQGHVCEDLPGDGGRHERGRQRDKPRLQVLVYLQLRYLLEVMSLCLPGSRLTLTPLVYAIYSYARSTDSPA